MAKHVCPICEDVYAQPGSVVVRSERTNQQHEAWHCPECSYSFIAVADAEKIAVLAAGPDSPDAFEFTLVKAGDGVVRRRP